MTGKEKAKTTEDEIPRAISCSCTGWAQVTLAQYESIASL